MTEPTPLELPEYKMPHHSYRCPVVRIWGPSTKQQHKSSHQNACLHIHGAYPYMFCRPTFASIDADSSSDVAHLQYIEVPGGGTVCVDWDDHQSVHEKLIETRILSDLIESACQAVLSRFVQRNNSSSNNKNSNDFSQGSASSSRSRATNGRTPLRVIRKVTIESGRSFFGYSTGGAAPFIQVSEPFRSVYSTS